MSPRYEYDFRSNNAVSSRFLGYYQRHAIILSPGVSGHYHDLGISSLEVHDSACNLVISAVIILVDDEDAHGRP